MNRFKQRQAKRAASAFVSLEVQDWNERERQAEAEAYQAKLAAYRFVIATILAARFNSTFPLEGFRDWYLISGIPVELSRHTRMGRTMTAIVMDHLQP